MICEKCSNQLKIVSFLSPEGIDVEITYCEDCKIVEEFTFGDFENNL